MAGKIFIATQSGSVEIKGQSYPFGPGTTVEEGHPLLKHFAGTGTFVEQESRIDYPAKTKEAPVEQATAAPGEKRTTRRKT